MNEATCENCKYWCEWAGKKTLGYCRRFPPCMEDDTFPATYNTEWCGEHARKEEQDGD